MNPYLAIYEKMNLYGMRGGTGKKNIGDKYLQI